MESIQKLGQEFQGDRFLITKQHHNRGPAANALAAFFSIGDSDHETRFIQLLRSLRGLSYWDSRNSEAAELNALLAEALTRAGGWENFKYEVAQGKWQKSWSSLRLTEDIDRLSARDLQAILDELSLPCKPDTSL